MKIILSKMGNSLYFFCFSSICFLIDVLVHDVYVQEIIRASVTPDKNAAELKLPVFDVKIPKPVAQSEEKPSAPTATVKTEENIVEEEDDDDFGEDDWDAFQSFPVSANDAGDESKTEDATEDPNLVEVSHTEGSFDSDDVGSQEHPKSKSVINTENPEEIKEEVVSNTADIEISPQSQPTSHESKTEQRDIPTDDCTDEPQDTEPRGGEQVEIHEVYDKVESTTSGTELVSGDHLSDKETKVSGELEWESEAEIHDIQDKDPSTPATELVSGDHLLDKEAKVSGELEGELEAEIHEVHDKDASIPVTELVSVDDLADKETRVSSEPEDKSEAEVYEVHDKKVSISGTEPVSGDHLSDRETEGTVEEELGANLPHVEHSLEQELSDSAVLKHSSSESDNNGQIK